MGHTVWSQRIAVDVLLRELEGYGKSLVGYDQEIYRELLKKSLKHIGSISFASSVHVWAFLLLSIMVEQEKRISRLEELYEGLAGGFVQVREQDCVMDEKP